MGIGYLLIGFAFLINPVIHVIDILPDCIGYVFLAAGLGKPAFFIDQLAVARGHFWKLAVIDLIKVFSILCWPYVSDTAMLLLSFVFSVFELMYFIPAVISLCEGYSFAALWYQGEAVYAKKMKKVRVNGKKELKPVGDMSTSWRNFTITFLCLRCAATIAPELTALQMFDYLGVVNAGAIDYTYYKPFLYVVLGITILIVGLVWFRRTFVYWNGIRKEKFFMDNLRRKYENDILPNTSLFCSRTMKRVSVCLAAVTVTSLFLVMDGINLMNGVISAAFLIAAACMTGKYVKLAYTAVPVAVVRMGFAVWSLILQYRYFSDYAVEAVDWITKAYNQYYFMAFIESVEYILAMISVVLFLVSYMKAIRIHLEQTGIQTEHAQYSKRNRDLEVYNMVGSRLLLTAVLTIINYVVSCMYHYLLVNVPMMHAVTIVVTLIWIAQTIFTITLINNQVYDRMAGEY